MFMSDISIIVRKMRLLAEANLASFDIGFPEQLVIMHLAAYGASSQAAIADKLEIDKGSIAKTVSKLEAKGLVKREGNPENRREKRVELAPEANVILGEMHSAQGVLDKAIFAGLSPKEIEVTCHALSVMANNLIKAEEEDRSR